MQAIILAAGMGRRLGELTENNTKCMLKVNGKRLIDRTLDCLCEFGLSRIIIVTGYKGDNVKRHVGNNYKGTDIVYVDNSIYDRTNNIYSLYLAKDFLTEDDTLLLESDLIFESSAVKKLLNDDYPNIALVDKYESWMDGTVVTLHEDGRIRNFISKKYFRYCDIEQYYKTVNIYKFCKDFSTNHYVPFLKAYCQALGNNEYYEQVLKVITLLEDAPLKALPLNNEKWYEIDDIQDLDIASSMFTDSDEEKWSAVTGRYGGYWRYPHMLDFCYLVNPYFPPQNMIDEMKASFESLLRNYPSGMKVNSLLAAKNFSVRQDYVAVGNGAAELISSIVEKHSGTMGVIFPTFEEYPNRSTRDKVIGFIPQSPDLHYTAKDIMEYFGTKEIDTLLLINPDNPSGNYIPFADLHQLIEWTAARKIKFIVDESFVDFVDTEGQTTLIDNKLLSSSPHLVVIKSISKSYGIPGLRLGIIASGDTSLIASIKKEVAIWNINSYGEFYMQIYEKYHNDYLKACDKFRKERKLFFNELKEIPYLTVIPSQANYFLCKVVSDRFTSKELAVKLLSDHDILIKDCSGKAAFGGGNFIRIAIRDRKDNHKLAETLKSL